MLLQRSNTRHGGRPVWEDVRVAVADIKWLNMAMLNRHSVVPTRYR